MRIEELLKDHETGNSDWQDYYFVTVRAGGTPYGMYKQALREMYRRLRGLRELACDRAIAILDIPTGNDERSRIERVRSSMRLEEADRAIENAKRELFVFYNLAKKLKEKVHPDGPITQEERFRLDASLWEFKLREMAALDLASGRRYLSPNTIEHLAAVPAEIRDRIMQDIHTNTLTDWYYNIKRDNILPEYSQLAELPPEDQEIYLLADNALDINKPLP